MRKTKEKKHATIKALHRKDNVELSMMALPGVILLFCFAYLPMYGLVIAFKNYVPLKGVWGSDWVGLENFKYFFYSVDAVRTLRNTVFYSLVFMVVDVVAALFVAVLLFNLKSKVGLRVYNTIMILPRFMSIVLITYIVYGLIAPKGVVNSLLAKIGIHSISFYTEAKWWPWFLTAIHIWSSVGMNSIMYLAQLMNVDSSLVEAARLDGANRWQIVKNVYIPHLYPLISIILILAVGKIFGGDFGLFYNVPMNQGSLYPTTDVLSTYTFRGFVDNSWSTSAAIGLMQSVAGCIMVVLSNLVVRKISPENSLF